MSGNDRGLHYTKTSAKNPRTHHLEKKKERRNSFYVRTLAHTVLKDAFHVKAVGGTCFIVCASLQVIGELACSSVIDDTRVSCTYSI